MVWVNPMQMAGPWITEFERRIMADAMRDECWYAPDAYKYVKLFESEFAQYHNRKYALMTPNCTTAIHLALAGAGIEENDEVIAPDCTWVGSTAGISHVRAIPVFADIDPVTWCVSAETINQRVSPATKAVIVVDLYGNMPNWNEIIADCGDLFLIEDAAEALGSCYRSRRAGSFGNCSVFSFHRTKTLTTGEGGMLLTDDKKLFDRCKFLRDHGRRPGGYYVEEVAFKYMPANINAALGYAQLQRIDELVGKKRAILHGYKERLKDFDLQFNDEGNRVYNGAWNTVVVFGKSYGVSFNEADKILAERQIPARPFFYPLSSLPAYREYHEYRYGLTPNAYDIANRGICLPSALNITEGDIDKVSEGIRDILS